QAHSPRAVISGESGEVYANFNGTGDHLFRVRGPGWIAEPLPERYDARFGNLYPSAMPGGGYAVVVEDDGGGGPQEESGTRVLTSSAGEGWSAVGVALPRLVLSGTHGVASNGAGTALLVA